MNCAGRRQRSNAFLCLLLSLALLAACSNGSDTAAGAAPPKISITTAAAVRRDFTLALDAVGTVTPVASVDVKPQMNSVVAQVHVREGQFVRAGELLFTLDSRSDEANVAKVRAQLAKDEAMLADARRQLARSRDLRARNFVSQGSVDANQTLVESQLATVAADRAALEEARVGLSYARVAAPSAGRAGAINVYPGSAVQASQTSLVTITRLDPIDVAFSLPQRYLPEALDGLKVGGAPVTITPQDRSPALNGRLQFVDNAIDLATGTVKVKARVDNPQARLWPGASVPVSLVAGTLKGATVIPVAATIQSARGQIVYVAAEGKATLRPVQILATQGEAAAVSGVEPGERVVLDGRQNLRPDSAVVERSEHPAPPAAKPAP